MKIINLIVLIGLLFTPTLIFADNLADDDTARDDTQVYHIDKDLDMVSTLKFNYDKPKIVVKSVYPQLQDNNDYIAHPGNRHRNDSYNDEVDGKMDSDTSSVGGFNQSVIQIVEEEINAFKRQVKLIQEKKASTSGKNNLYVDYDTSVIRSGRNRIISVRFSMQASIGGAANRYHYHRVLNYDLDNNQKIELQDLFKPESNYLNALSHYTGGVLMRRFPRDSVIVDGAAPKVENYAIWNVKPRGLLITFDAYQVAPYEQGAQTIFVPYSALKEVLSPKSPINSCIKHRTSCMRDNLLTGGFIDEAVNTNHGRFDPIFSKL